MPIMNMPGLEQYYELHGSPERPALLLISGLGGVGASWGPQVELLARDFHVVGSSTGGAIAQELALIHGGLVRSLVIASSFARFDAYMRRQFEVRAVMAAQWDKPEMFAGYSLFLFSPRYTRDHPERVQQWIDRCTAQPSRPEDRTIGLKRIAMIASHDTLADLPRINHPTLVLCGEQNHCTPVPLSEEIAAAIPGAELVIFPEGGELIELEMPDSFAERVRSFLLAHA